MTQFVFDFAQGSQDQKDLLGGKGANLAEMKKLGLPVPPGLVAEHSGQLALADDARARAARTFELSELLIDVLSVEDVGAWFPHTVTYHPTCHSLRLLCVGDRPLRLLRAVEDIDIVELPQAESCCGFGGTFALKNNEVSAAMLEDKVSDIVGSGAQIVTMGDSSCLLHIGGGLSRQLAGVRAVHLAEVLAASRETPWDPAS